MTLAVRANANAAKTLTQRVTRVNSKSSQAARIVLAAMGNMTADVGTTKRLASERRALSDIDGPNSSLLASRYA